MYYIQIVILLFGTKLSPKIKEMTIFFEHNGQHDVTNLHYVC